MRAASSPLAWVPLPPDLRRRYADGPYACLPRDCRGLLITLEYPPDDKDGPPFPVGAAEVERLFTPSWRTELLERRDILADEPGFRAEGVSALTTAVWALVRDVHGPARASIKPQPGGATRPDCAAK